MGKITFSKSVARALCSLSIVTFLVAAQCCTVAPAPVVTDPASWAARLKAADSRLVADKATVLNLKVEFTVNFDEYRFKVGADSTTNCASETGYTGWTTKANRLQADISSVADGKVKLCIVGRGKNNCGNVITQSPSAATFYRWIKDTKGPGAFSITGPTGTQASTSFAATWGAASEAASYTASVHSASGCASSTMLSQYSASSTTATVTVPAAGTYYLCVKASDAVGNVTSASNNGYSVTVTTSSAGTVIEDRVSDSACWALGANDPYFAHYVHNGSKYTHVASAFMGNGRNIKSVSILIGFIAKSNSDDCHATDWSNMSFGMLFFENLATYIANPYPPVNTPGVISREQIVPANNDPSKANFYRNPVGSDSYGCPVYRIDVDMADLNVNLRTTEGQASAIILAPAGGSAQSVWGTTYSGKNSCLGAVGGTLPDYYTPPNQNFQAKSFTELGYVNANGLYRIVSE